MMKPLTLAIAVGAVAGSLLHAAHAEGAKNVSLPVLTHAVRPGEAIDDKDIMWRDFQNAPRGGMVATDPSMLVGQAVRRPLPPGQPVQLADIVEPLSIRRGDSVVMIVRAKGMVLTATARALEDGRDGDVIHLQNLTTKRTVDARVLRAGQAEVVTNLQMAARVASAN